MQTIPCDIVLCKSLSKPIHPIICLCYPLFVQSPIADLRETENQKVPASIITSAAAVPGNENMAGSTADELRLKFLFANQDGVHVQLSFRKAATVAQVKAQLMRSWPQSSSWFSLSNRPKRLHNN